MVVGGILAAMTACSPPNNTFSGAPMPPMAALSCEFGAVHSGVLNPDYARDHPGGRLTLTFTSLDAANGTATLIGNLGAGTVEFRQNGNQLQFIEETVVGNLSVTTVFAPPREGASLPAVHSRHMLIAPANASISQFAGSCRPKA